MADPSSQSDDKAHGSRLLIESDSVHEGEDGIYLDCPKCGSNVSFGRIVATGRCSNTVDDELKDAVDGQEGGACDARLALELVWES